MRIAYNNLIDDLDITAIAASSELSGYPIDNIQDQRLTKKWYSDSSTTQTVIFDLGATTACSIFAILSHNCTSTGTVTVKGNDSIASGMTWMTTGESSTQTITYNQDIMLSFITSLSNRYWKFTFSGQTSALEIGRLWIGNYLTISPSSLDDFTVTKKRDDLIVYGKNRQKYASAGVGWRRFELKFPKTATTAVSNILTFYDTVGSHSSFIFCNFDTSRSYELVDPCYCSLDGDITFDHRGGQYYTYSLAMEEDL